MRKKNMGIEHTFWWSFAWIWVIIQVIAGIVFIWKFIQINLASPFTFLIGLPVLFASISFVLDFLGIRKRKLS